MITIHSIPFRIPFSGIFFFCVYSFLFIHSCLSIDYFQITFFCGAVHILEEDTRVCFFFLKKLDFRIGKTVITEYLVCIFHKKYQSDLTRPLVKYTHGIVSSRQDRDTPHHIA